MAGQEKLICGMGVWNFDWRYCRIFMGGGKYISVEVIRIFLWGIPSAILFMAVYVFFYDKNILPFFVLVGNISYYIYLTHP